MAFLKLGSTVIERDGERVYVIAEIGQNHQGSLETAKKMILEAKHIGCDCVKFQKSCLQAKFTKSALDRIYEGTHSWGYTYGDHKLYLEFSNSQFVTLRNFCNRIQIDFTASAMDEISLEWLDSMNVPFIKIGSGDANNIPLLEKASHLVRPLIISTGMQCMSTIELIVRIMKKAKKTNFALMHCVSAYPTQPKDCTLRIINLLKEKFPDILIGYSGHELGIDITKVAVLLGARIVERHFTLDRQQKGSDHMCSLESKDMSNLVRYIRDAKTILANDNNVLKNLPNSTGIEILMEALLPVGVKGVLPCELVCRQKLGKSLVAAKTIFKGQTLVRGDILVKVSEPIGISAEYYYHVIGAIVNSNISEDSPIMWCYIKNEEISCS